MSAPAAEVGPRLKPLALRVGLYLVLFILAHYLASLVAAGAISAWLPGGLTAIEETISDPRWLLLVSMGAALPVIGVSLLWWRSLERRPLAELGLGRRTQAGGLFAQGAALGALLVLATALPGLFMDPAGVRFLPEGPGATLRALLTLAPGLLFVAWNEEIACRGVLMRQLIGGVSPLAAALLSSLLFAALHLLNPHLAPIALLNLVLAGLMLALAALATDGLWFPAGLHFAWNLSLGGLLGLPVSGVPVAGLLDLPARGPEWLTGGSFGPEGGVAATLVVGVAIVLLYRRADAAGRLRLPRAPVNPADQEDGAGHEHEHGDPQADGQEAARLGSVDRPLPAGGTHARADEQDRADEEQRRGDGDTRDLHLLGHEKGHQTGRADGAGGPRQPAGGIE